MIVIRSLVFLICAFILTFLMGIAAIPVRLVFKRSALAYARLWCRLLLRMLHVICGIDYRVVGYELLPKEGPFLIASQHQSAFDTLLWMTLLPAPAYVMKEELTKIPLVGPMLLLTGMMPVERSAGAKALRSLLKVTDQAVAAGRQIIIFPEGTRVPWGQKEPLKPGVAAMARHSGLPLFPVATDSGRFWGKAAFLKYPGTISVVVCPAVSGRDRAALLGDIEEAWSKGQERIASGL